MIKLLATLLLSLCLAACVKKTETPETHYYSLDLPSIDYKKPEPDAKSLRVLPTTVDPNFSGKQFVYRESENRYVNDPYNQFLTPVSLQASPYFYHQLHKVVNAQVIDADNLMIADYLLQLHINTIYADYSVKTTPLAKASVTATLYENNNGSMEVVYQNRFYIAEPIVPNNPEALVTIYNRELKEMSDEIGSEVNKVIGS